MGDILTLQTERPIQLLELTQRVQEWLQRVPGRSGLCLVFCPHTTAGVMINENADPEVAADLERAFAAGVPSVPFRHAEGNSPAHYLAALMGSSVLAPVVGGRLELGRWQGIFFCEFDGPRRRTVRLNFLAG